MRRLGRLPLALMLALTTTVTTWVVTGAAASAAPAAPAVACDGQWHESGTFVGEWVSGWIPTTPGTDYTRSIQYRALGGVTALRGVPPTGQGPCAFVKKNFATATQYRYQVCHSTIACEETDFQNYQGGPTRGWLFPGKVVGYDINANQWRQYADV